LGMGLLNSGTLALLVGAHLGTRDPRWQARMLRKGAWAFRADTGLG
jgi:hypothetical protein